MPESTMGVKREFNSLLLVTALLSLDPISTFAETTLCVTPESSPGSCHTSTRCNDRECHTLEDYSRKNNSTITSNSQLFFLSGNHSLGTTLLIRNKSNLSLIGDDQGVIVLCRHHEQEENVGFRFENIDELIVKNIWFIQCGAAVKDYQNKHKENRASLVILQGSNLTLINITILEGVDAGIISIDVRGLTSISHLTIANTEAKHHQQRARGNEIVYLNSSKEYSTNYQLIIQDSRIMKNKCVKTNQVAGLTVHVSKCYATIRINGSQFIENCGNLAILLKNITKVSALQVSLTNSIIERGNATKGGGVYVFITKYANKSMQPYYNYNNITEFISSATVIENVTFSGNVANYLGAAFYIQLKASTEKVMVYHNITLKNCTFYENHLVVPKKGGIAIHSNFFDIDGYSFQINPQYRIHLRDCYFQNHFIESKYNNSRNWGKTSGNSVIFINTNDYFEFENITVTNNSVNAITAVNSNLIFRGHTTLSYNNGSSGGGLLLCQDTIMYLAPNTTIDIFKNRVSHAGGGICVEPHCLQTRPRCFFQAKDEIKYRPGLLNTAHVNIYNNTAAYGGSNLFGGDVDFCYMIDSPEMNMSPFNSSFAYQTIFNISNNESSSVTSRPRHICFCEEGKLNCDTEEKHVTSYPGETVEIKAVLVGQENGTVPGVVQTSSVTGGINFTGNVQDVNCDCSCLSYVIFGNTKLSKVQVVNLSIGVRHTRDQSGYERLWEFKQKYLIVHLKDCPIGFTLSSSDDKKNSTCANCVLGYQDLECNIKKNSRVFIIRKKLGTTWIGYEYGDGNNDNMPTSIKYNKNCPFDYCVEKRVKLKMLKQHYSSATICANNRSGIACGACQNGYSALLGSSKCGQCTNYSLALVVVFAIAGFALVVALTLLNLNISEGTLSGLIFYANVVESNSAFVLPHEKHYIFPTPILRVFVAWINLDLGIRTCFYDGMDAYAEAWLEFAFPLYIWSIAVIIILLGNRFQVVAIIASKNAVKVLATLVLLSYTKFSHAIISTFSYTDIHTLTENSSSYTTERAWLIDTNVMYFEFKHSLLLTVALLCGLICLPFALTLFFIKPLQRFSDKKPFKWLEILKPFLDAYTGPYTDSGRFWPGMLLLARICLSISGGLNTLSSKRVVQSVTSLVVIILLVTAGLVRPGLYRSRLLDALEYFFLLNIAVLLLGMTYSDGKESYQKAVYDTTVGLAFFIFILIVLYHLWLKIRKYSFIRIFIAWVKTKHADLCNTASSHGATQTMNNFPPFVAFNEEREPLLADHDE